MFYYNTPLQYFPLTQYYSPYSNAALQTNGCKSNSVENNLSTKDKSPTDSPVIYQDRNVRIQHKDDNVVFSLDLPGIKSSDAKVEIRDGVLSVQAERKLHDNGTAKYAQHFLLKDSDLDSDKLQAHLADGVLTITIPKKEPAKPYTIPVFAENAPARVEKDSKDVRFSVDLPGVKVADVKLELNDDTISLHAERKILERVSTIDKYFSVDRAKVEPTAFKAYLLDGVLTITGYLKNSPEPKPIAVTDGSSTAMAIDEEVKEEKKTEDEEMVVVTVSDEK